MRNASKYGVCCTALLILLRLGPYALEALREEARSFFGNEVPLRGRSASSQVSQPS